VRLELTQKDVALVEMESDHKEHPKTVRPDDYWGQIKRTINGRPVSDEQISMIVKAILDNLSFADDKADTLLDLGCGNGALSRYFFDHVSEFLGVDFSEYLISVALRDFQKAPEYCFVLHDVLNFLVQEPRPERFTKVLCYGCFSYFPDGESLLDTLNRRFKTVTRVFVGNLPDRDRASVFYGAALPAPTEMNDYNSKIGIWRSRDEFAEMAKRTGWNICFHDMPAAFYASHYRYDALLTRRR